MPFCASGDLRISRLQLARHNWVTVLSGFTPPKSEKKTMQ